MRFTDPDGMWPGDPGDLFKTPDAAARDFAKLYNDNSIARKKEFATTIYKVAEGHYSYTPPAEGTEAGAQPSDADSGPAFKNIAVAHTHANYSSGKYDDNHFSPADIKYAKSNKIPVYAATPNGSLLNVNPDGRVSNVKGKNDIPSDLKDPTKINNIDSSKLPKNEPMYSIGDWLKFNIMIPISKGASAIKN